MKIFFVVILLISFYAWPLAGTAQNKPIKKVWIHKHLYRVYPTYCNFGLPSFSIVLHDSPPPGSYVLYFKKDHSKIAALFNVGQNRTLDGEITEFYFNGKVSLKSYYYQGVDTFYTEFYKSGVRMYEGHQKMSTKRISDPKWPGVYAGPQKEWYSNGNLKSIENFDNDGVRNGPQTAYYKNERKSDEYYYKHGLMDSLKTSWHENGQIFKQVRYKAGAFVNQDKAVYYYPNGKPAFTGSLFNNCELGACKGFYNNGEKKWEGSFDTVVYCFNDDCVPGPMSTKLGKWTYYYPDGKLMAKGSYKLWEPWNEADPETKNNDWQYFDKNGNAIKSELLMPADHEMIDSIFMENYH